MSDLLPCDSMLREAKNAGAGHRWSTSKHNGMYQLVIGALKKKQSRIGDREGMGYFVRL